MEAPTSDSRQDLCHEAPGSKLGGLTPIRIFKLSFSEEEHQRASRELLAEMQREWEKDWSGL
jgi:hypothetical protein